MDIKSISPKNNVFANQLVHIPRPPKTLFYRGELPKERKPTVAIVGARKPTSYGFEIASMLAKELGMRGVIIASGMAIGIDSIAHRAALDVNATTLAVLANGVDKLYPRSSEKLGEDIISSGGAVLSEYPVGTPARPYQFLARNRIISGISSAIIVIEAAERSGTLSTANHALEQGKEVFAVPGNITSPLSVGCNNLIRIGATPLTSTKDVLDFLFPDAESFEQTQILAGSTPAETLILEIINRGIREGSEILKTSNLSVSEYSQSLSMLEINGQIKPLGANCWAIR